MQSANLSGPLKGCCPNNALLGLTQAPGLAGGFDFRLISESFLTLKCFIAILCGKVYNNCNFILITGGTPHDKTVEVAGTGLHTDR